MSSWLSPRDDYQDRNHLRKVAGNQRPARTRPLQFGLTMVLVASLLLLGMAEISRYAVGEPIMPDWVAKAIHHKEPSLPPGVTWDFSVLNPATKQPYAQLPEVGTVLIRLAVTNDSALPVKMRFRSSNQCEFVVRRVFYYVDSLFALPLEVWRSSYFHNISSNPTTLFLQPGQSKVFTATFDFTALNARQTPPGAYRIIAIIDAVSTGRWETSLPLNKPQ